MPSLRAWVAGEFGDLHRFVIEVEGVFVGCRGLNQIDSIHRRANLGYWVCTAHSGRGYATAATKLLARFALGLRDLERVEIVAAVENVASRRVAEKAGAIYEGNARRRVRQHGVMHDACVFSFVSGDVVA
ncbi:MAG: GNAT family N-acetyltransferase [Planctomycetes bacterium]|nr:GNAT family N-acetyltransferase [Planctomycetota bacterium]